MVDIATQAPSWGGTPRRNSNQYIQSTIDANPAGTTYVLQAGVHEGQSFEVKAGDTIVFASGAKLSGAEDISGGWTSAGSGRYSKGGIARGDQSEFGNSECLIGYECGEMNCVLVDGRLLAWVTDIADVDEWTAYYDSGTVYIYGNPSGKTVEICRHYRAIHGEVNNVTVKADNTAEGGGTAPATFFGEIYGYANDAQDERAALIVGRDEAYPSTPVGTGIVYQDIRLSACAGTGFAPAVGTVCRRMIIEGMGQLGHCGGGGGVRFYNCRVANNGVGGWDPGWEGGNNKIAVDEDWGAHACLFELTSPNPHIAMTGVHWFDISNDGCYTYDSYLIDTQEKTYRGLFWEISESAKFIRNVCWGLCRDSENAGWAKGIFSSESGPVVGSTWDTIEIAENHLYRCGGGPGGVENGPREYTVNDLDVHHNIVYFDDAAPYQEETGIVDWNPSYDPTGCDYDYNVYFVPSATEGRWRNEVDGGSGAGLTFAEWQADGQDTNGAVVTERVHPSGDPDPFNGGCLVGGF